MNKIDPIKLSQELIRCPSVTPIDAGALDVLEEALKSLGFDVVRQTFSEDGTEDVDNLYASFGEGENLCFAGHTDIVPVGDLDAWSVDPFAAEIVYGELIGRGAVDMKVAIAAWVAAISRVLANGEYSKKLSLLITGDEEGVAINGTRKMLEFISDRGEVLDACIVGEPTNPNHLGEMIKIGRRGSVTFHLTVNGQQGHVAYPHNADNPITKLSNIAYELNQLVLDDGSEHFQASNLEITNIDTGNSADNVIPANTRLTCNIRFNDHHNSQGLIDMVDTICKKHADDYKLDYFITGESFLTEPGRLSDIVSSAVENITGLKPKLSTTGGTSDARFIKNYCPVVECGLINKTAHQVDEKIAVADIEKLTDIYEKTILAF